MNVSREKSTREKSMLFVHVTSESFISEKSFYGNRPDVNGHAYVKVLNDSVSERH